MKVSARRKFLKMIAGAGLATAAGITLLSRRRDGESNNSEPTGSGPVQFKEIGVAPRPVGINPLRIPELLEGSMNGAEREFHLQVQHGVTRFFPELETPTIGVNGSYLGPTLRLRDGESVVINVSNTMNEDTTVHWHGLHVPAKQDGGPHQLIPQGETWRSFFTMNQKASTCWYHSHIPHHTGSQVYRGLAGLLIVEDDDSVALDLPSQYGIDDIPLILQDRTFDESGSLVYPTDVSTLMRGVRGDTLVLNGTVSPYFDATTDRVRFRILNAANARTFTIACGDGRAFQMIASDNAFLESPLELTHITLAPGERAEIVITLNAGENLHLVNLPVPAGPLMYNGQMNGMMRNLDKDGFDVLLIRAAEALAISAALPAGLTQIERLREEDATVTRRFELGMGNGTGAGGGREGRGAGGGGNGGGNGGGYGGAIFRLNGLTMNMSRIDFEVQEGTTEIWELSNVSPMIHPFHVHKVHFQILDRNGVPPRPEEQGFKDTVRVHVAETVRIIARFDDFPDPETPYMYHCHILEHEDHGMMGQFVVV
ncbi:MAG: multicopper oxidase domain-containing protein [Gammaproteobacteria bacterium]|nr:multicopper oxidase domain-containing protein [Gammaproteobacteria bacterium]MDP2139404.1 multicopper oxidase domain-containing protein [Gammaproteobacteria bacterium]MDP2346240.1 multicopper oxidase domain-containing protein [Gammaproteobacteria bacterium]